MTELDTILRQLKRSGYQVTLNGRDHWTIRDSQGRYVTTAPKTSRSVSGTRNLRAAIKRHERQRNLERSTA